jgi:hypothetical protein
MLLDTVLRFSDLCVGDVDVFEFDFGKCWTDQCDPIVSATVTSSNPAGLEPDSPPTVLDNAVSARFSALIPNIDYVPSCEVVTQIGNEPPAQHGLMCVGNRPLSRVGPFIIAS